MCTTPPPEGKYWKEAPDWLMQPRVWVWDKLRCYYRLVSSLSDDEYSSYEADPNYSEIFISGGGVEIDQSNDATSTAPTGGGTSIFDGVQKYLVPDKLEQNNMLQKALLIAALVIVVFLLYKLFKK